MLCILGLGERGVLLARDISLRGQRWSSQQIAPVAPYQGGEEYLDSQFEASPCPIQPGLSPFSGPN